MAHSDRGSQDEARRLGVDADAEEPPNEATINDASEDAIPEPSEEVDLAESAERLIRLIEAEAAADAAKESPPPQQQQKKQLESPPDGLSGFLDWLTSTRQLGRRANSLLAAVSTLRAPKEHRDRLTDLVRLNLLLECNSAIGFNADGTLRNIQESARVWTAADEEAASTSIGQQADANATEASAAAASLAELRNRMSHQFQLDNPAELAPQLQAGDLVDDAEVLIAKEEIMQDGGQYGLLVFTILAMVASVVATFWVPAAYHWHAEWLVLVTATTTSLMLSVAIFVRAGRRLRPIEAYREMGRELQSHRILISTIRHNG